jgi:parallel beta-helix repeat protein
VEQSQHVTIRNVKVWHGQNGIVIDRVTDARIYGNDCSFLSGWGLGMWRSSRAVVSRNAFDFCVRGYSHGVYNRGQDSAGILMFEQCSDNVFVENSATHGGDGFFGFAGKEALGEAAPREDLAWYKRRGNNDNVFARNDFSFAAAHGLELTFSFGNRITGNTFRENAICGIWGGYSQDTAIGENLFRANGAGAYGLERGGINIEHGRNNLILLNQFQANRCGVHLWWDDDGGLLALPWARANLQADQAPAAVVCENRFDADETAIHLRDLKLPVRIAKNSFDNIGEPMRVQGDSTVIEDAAPAAIEGALQAESILGERDPRGQRSHLHGREKIIMTQWGPYDWQSPLLRRVDAASSPHTSELLGGGRIDPASVVVEGGAAAAVEGNRITISPNQTGSIAPYVLSTVVDGTRLVQPGTLVSAAWQISVFAYATDPRQDVEQWRSESASGVSFNAAALTLSFGHGGPSQLELDPRLAEANLPRDRFGTIASTRLRVPAGAWRIATVSDDGIRVWLDDQLIIDDWSWHGPTPHDFVLSVPELRDITLRVEHFELDGFATLSLEIDQATP